MEYGSQDEQYNLLIDGGPGTVYKNYLKEALVDIQKKGGENKPCCAQPRR